MRIPRTSNQQLRTGLLIACALLALPAAATSVSRGSIERLANISFNDIPERPIDVWLPEGYPKAAPYAVLYMHDGQMLFDASVTWNKQEWRVDEVAGALIDSGEVRPFIVVAVHNAGERRGEEYFPQQADSLMAKADRERLTQMARAAGAPMPKFAADAYVRFLADTLKPAIDGRYATDRSPAATALMGSSMGGLISMYGALERPDVFGAAACLSTHWPGGDPNEPAPGEAILRYVQKQLPSPGKVRLYFDFGTATLDAFYPSWQARADAILRRAGYSNADWVTQRFEGAEHNEVAWGKRLDVPLRFLFGR